MTTTTFTNGTLIVPSWMQDVNDDVYADWTSYTPVVTAGTGTFTSVSATGKSLVKGKLCYFQASITITTNGTAASYISCTLPFASSSSAQQTVSGIETATTGKTVSGLIPAGSSSMVIRGYDGAYLGANGYIICVTGVYKLP